MLKLSPNLSWLFADRPFAQRIDAASEAGFTAFEFGFYGGADLAAVQKAVEGGMQVALFNMDIPDWADGVHGYLAHPDQQDRFRQALDESLAVAQRIHAAAMMIPVGTRDTEVSLEEQIDCVVDNLTYAAPLAAETGVMLTIEALYHGNVPGYFLDSSQLGIEITQRVHHPNVKFQFDTYHLQMLEGSLIETLQDNLEWIGHIQIGDAPGRVAPGGGEIDIFGFVEAALEAGYDGFLGLEYHPGDDPLGWIPTEWMGND